MDNNFLKTIGIFAYLLVILGAINLGLVGVLKFNLIAFIFGDMTTTTRIIYAIIGLSAAVSLIVISFCAIEHKCE